MLSFLPDSDDFNIEGAIKNLTTNSREESVFYLDSFVDSLMPLKLKVHARRKVPGSKQF